ncbi:MAG: hypothetical protein LBQ88_03680 [Treponema sp.]|jgi:hypothetical protein|nr:hypothetical protein [Treponema sp.]
MWCAWELTRKDGAVGIDGGDAEEYERNLWENLQSLAGRLKSGLYRAPAVKRVYIPKAGSSGPEVRCGVAPGTPEAPQGGAARSDSAEAPGTLCLLRNSLNFDSIAEFSLKVHRIWFKWQGRLSAQRDRTWTQFNEYLRKYPLPPPKIVHSYC